MEIPPSRIDIEKLGRDFIGSDVESDFGFNDESIVLEKLLPGYEMVGEPYRKPNGKGYVRIYLGLEQLGDLIGHFEPRYKYAIVIDTVANYYLEDLDEQGAICITHHGDESEWLVWATNSFVEQVCKIEAREEDGI